MKGSVICVLDYKGKKVIDAFLYNMVYDQRHDNLGHQLWKAELEFTTIASKIFMRPRNYVTSFLNFEN
mgnify:CR=1 FL=1